MCNLTFDPQITLRYLLCVIFPETEICWLTHFFHLSSRPMINTAKITHYVPKFTLGIIKPINSISLTSGLTTNHCYPICSMLFFQKYYKNTTEPNECVT